MKKNLLILISLLALTAIAVYWFLNRPSKSFDDTFADFAIEDTASVGKIFIADKMGKSVTLSRTSDGWYVNDSIKARDLSVNLILRVAHDITVQSPVAETARENMIKRLAAEHRKVEYYDRDGKLIKIWYIGSHSQDLYGTFMLQEYPGGKRADRPYIVEIPWHKGYITPMFFTNVNDWRFTAAFYFPKLDIDRIDVRNFQDTSQSFTVRKTGNEFRLHHFNSTIPVSSYDTLLLKDFVSNFKNLHYNYIDTLITAFQIDSLLKSVPLFRISVTSDEGKQSDIVLYERYQVLRKDEVWEENKPIPVDKNLMHGILNKKDFVTVQYFNFNPVLIRKSDFVR